MFDAFVPDNLCWQYYINKFFFFSTQKVPIIINTSYDYIKYIQVSR